MTPRRRTRWERFYAEQMKDPKFRVDVEARLVALRVAVELAKLRQRCGLTRGQLAARAGISASRVFHIETNPSTSLKLCTLDRLAWALGHSLKVRFRRRLAPRPGGKPGRRRSR